jgi:hypothetical protein
MAITIEANYSKKLGLPEYSSHQYSITVRTEVTDLSQIEAESNRLYGLLQTSVDNEMQNPGWLPGDARQPQAANPAQARNQNANATAVKWKCSDPQRELIVKIAREHDLTYSDLDALAQARCRVDVTELNKLQASAVIDELLSVYGTGPRTGGKHHSFRRGSNSERRTR